MLLKDNRITSSRLQSTQEFLKQSMNTGNFCSLLATSTGQIFILHIPNKTVSTEFSRELEPMDVYV